MQPERWPRPPRPSGVRALATGPCPGWRPRPGWPLGFLALFLFAALLVGAACFAAPEITRHPSGHVDWRASATHHVGGTLAGADRWVHTASPDSEDQFALNLGSRRLRAHYLNPTTGRFWTMDSFEGNASDPLSLHKYLYAHENPVMNTDPSGHESLIGVSIGSSLSGSLSAIYNGTVSGVGSALQASIFGVQAGQSMNEILTGFILDETGIGLAIDGYQALRGYFDGDARGQRALELAEFNLVFGVYVAPWLMTADDDEAFEVVDEIFTPQCLVAGTPVETMDGLRAIETIRRGDSVWAWNDQTGERELKRVAHTFTVQRNELLEIVVDDVRVVATPDHPFFTQDKRWNPAGQLAAGDLLFDECNPEGRAIRSVERRQETCTVYNMEVEGLHNFFVTSAGILTHNVNYNHFFQNSFVRATGMKGLRYGKAALGNARRMGKDAHRAFHAEFNTFLDGINMRPGANRSSKQIVNDMNLNFDQVVAKFRPFFASHPTKAAKWTKLFDQEVAALRAGLRSVPPVP